MTLAPLTSSARWPPWVAVMDTPGRPVQWVNTNATMMSAWLPLRMGLRSPWSVKYWTLPPAQSLNWAGGNVQYFTDQGDLSPILSGNQADIMVAFVFTHWTGLPGVSITATQGGHLAEDVSGANVIGFPDGTYTVPADIQPNALTTPVGVVYDYDGQVTDAILGAGAGGLDFCFT